MSALKWRNLEIDIITNLEMEFSATAISITLLTRLSNAKILTDNSDLILSIFYQIWTKEMSFSRFGLVDRSSTPSSIESFKWRHFDTCLITIIIGEFCEWQASNPFLFIYESTGS